ncbi:diadenylate cyclase CdaA [Fictibacillus sp. KIGAM418]|uniref:Diadenylate cyclase n=1 Tax=Fictibacillus marinisediminis TaxID=2878389 RepID=A0A9X2BF95_9BACL|nr:diadenylate cyclase CdaA [Fictibacillus marinisediminis]MCK6255238.1 diadenylate cyclase CdaA [Fictibacillus marinisediminis]
MLPVGNFSLGSYISQIVDILLVTYVFYKLIMLIRGTKAVQLLKGIVVIVAVWLASSFFELRTMGWLMDKAITYGLLAIIIIFQPELRRALEQLGRGKLFSRSGLADEEEMGNSIDAIVKSTSYMAKRRIGAIISFERETGLTDYVETGIPIHSKLSSELLTNIFVPNTPLHDGAVILRQNEIVAAGCYLPLTESPFVSKELGTRHRAAIGVSEVTDAITVIVSEETGSISITKNGEIHRNLNEETLRALLNAELMVSGKNASSSRWNWRGKKNGQTP